MLVILYHRNGDLSQAMVEKNSTIRCIKGESMLSHKDLSGSLTRQGTNKTCILSLERRGIFITELGSHGPTYDLRIITRTP